MILKKLQIILKRKNSITLLNLYKTILCLGVFLITSNLISNQKAKQYKWKKNKSNILKFDYIDFIRLKKWKWNRQIQIIAHTAECLLQIKTFSMIELWRCNSLNVIIRYMWSATQSFINSKVCLDKLIRAERNKRDLKCPTCKSIIHDPNLEYIFLDKQPNLQNNNVQLN